MNDDGRTTSQQLYIPTLLVVGGCDALVARCRLAAKSTGLAIKACLLKEVAITVPYRQPLAMVVPNDAFDSAAYELEALARDVRSVLLRVDPEVSVRELEAMIAGAVDGCLSQRERRGGAGRYSITEGVEDEAPFSSRSSAPPSSRAPRSLSSPGIASTRRPSGIVSTQLPAVARAATEPPPVSGAQPRASGPFAAIRSLFSSR